MMFKSSPDKRPSALIAKQIYFGKFSNFLHYLSSIIHALHAKKTINIIETETK